MRLDLPTPMPVTRCWACARRAVVARHVFVLRGMTGKAVPLCLCCCVAADWGERFIFPDGDPRNGGPERAAEA